MNHALLIENRLLQLLAEIGQEVTATTVETRSGRLRVQLRIFSDEERNGGAPLGARERAVLDIARIEIARLGRRALGAEIRVAIHAAGHRWSTSTINATLADLVANGHLVNDADRRGYGLPDASD